MPVFSHTEQAAAVSFQCGVCEPVLLVFPALAWPEQVSYALQKGFSLGVVVRSWGQISLLSRNQTKIQGSFVGKGQEVGGERRTCSLVGKFIGIAGEKEKRG